MIELVLEKAMKGMVHISEHMNNFEILFTFLIACLEVIKNKNEQSKFPKFALILNQFLTSYKKRDTFSCSRPEITFYNHCFKTYPEIMLSFITDGWLNTITIEFKTTFENI